MGRGVRKNKFPPVVKQDRTVVKSPTSFPLGRTGIPNKKTDNCPGKLLKNPTDLIQRPWSKPHSPFLPEPLYTGGYQNFLTSKQLWPPFCYIWRIAYGLDEYITHKGGTKWQSKPILRQPGPKEPILKLSGPKRIISPFIPVSGCRQE
jgi:hypothetical protein